MVVTVSNVLDAADSEHIVSLVTFVQEHTSRSVRKKGEDREGTLRRHCKQYCHCILQVLPPEAMIIIHTCSH
jgi:hypothetical protein